jgi:hypothetical protein
VFLFAARSNQSRFRYYFSNTKTTIRRHFPFFSIENIGHDDRFNGTHNSYVLIIKRRIMRFMISHRVHIDAYYMPKSLRFINSLANRPLSRFKMSHQHHHHCHKLIMIATKTMRIHPTRSDVLFDLIAVSAAALVAATD